MTKCTGVEGQSKEVHNVWGCSKCNPIEVLPSREEKEFLASEYDKCFGTSPRSDEIKSEVNG